MLNPNFAVLNLSYVNSLLYVYEYKVNKIYRNSKIIVQNCFQRFYWDNRVRWSEYDTYCQQHMINTRCCLRLKSKQISEFSQKRSFSCCWLCQNRIDFLGYDAACSKHHLEKTAFRRENLSNFSLPSSPHHTNYTEHFVESSNRAAGHFVESWPT